MDWVSEIAPPDWSWFRRGYTGHEMLPEFGLINMFVTLTDCPSNQSSGTIPMNTFISSSTEIVVFSGNGRAYDPVLGRMLQVDNYVQNPFSTQSYNRYSYVLNNPLKYVDPDGENPILIAMAVGAFIGAGTSAVIYTTTTLATGQQWTLNSFGRSAAFGAIGGALGGGLGYLGSQIGGLGQSLGYNILSNVASNSATTLAFGGDITAGSLAGMVAGGIIGNGIGNFKGVSGGVLKNIGAELSFGAFKGAVTGLYGSAIGAAIDGRDLGQAMVNGLKYGAISGTTMAGLNIATLGASYKPDRSYGDFGRHGPVYRRGTFITRAILKNRPSGITIGRNILVQKLKGKGWEDPENGYLIDTYKFNQNIEAHETFHYIQQREMGFANFYFQWAKEVISYGLSDCYCTPNTLEWNADMYGIYQVGTIYR